MAKFSKQVSKKIGKGYNCEKQGIEDSSFLYLPDSSTENWPQTKFITPKELVKKGKK